MNLYCTYALKIFKHLFRFYFVWYIIEKNKYPDNARQSACVVFY